MNKDDFGGAVDTGRTVRLVPAPLTHNKTVQGHEGVMLSKQRLADGRLIVTIGIITRGGKSFGALLDKHSFNIFCLELADIIEAEIPSASKIWEGETIQ